MTIPKFVSITQLSTLPEGRARLVVGPGGARYVCVRRGAEVHVLDDRCPHEGHPLSMGLVRGDVLTCPWHNWKFELASGQCVFGGEGVRRYASEVVNGEVFVDPALDAVATRARLEQDLARAAADGAVDMVVREGLRLASLAGTMDAPVALLAVLAATRAPRGVGDAVAALAACTELHDAGVLTRAEALALGGAAVADEVRARPARPWPPPRPGALEDAHEFLLDLLEERRDDAAARVSGLPPAVSAESVLRAWFLPFASLKAWDRGATLVRVHGVAALAPRLPAATARQVATALSVSLGWAVAESDLPPWRATRQALLDARGIAPGEGPVVDAPALAHAVLTSESIAVTAVLSAMRAGAAPRAVVRVVAGAAVERLARYDVAWSHRAGMTVTAMEPARAVTFARAALALDAGHLAVAHAVIAAGLVGKLRRFDAPRGTVGTPTTPRVGGLAALTEALSHRHADRATAALAGLADADLATALDALTRFGALEARGAEARSGAAVLACAARALAHDAPALTRRACDALVRALIEDPPAGLSRVAANAAKFLDDGLPPESDE